MIKHIELKNFMSHPHSVIELAEGLTVLVGENNTGKSALINAIQVLCRNAGGDYMVRHGEQECSVKAETDEGFVVEWKRKGSAVSYSINGTDVYRLRGSVPEHLHKFLRLPLVETENNPFEIHFGEQKTPIFLLDESAGRRATFFASSSDTIKLIEMQNRHRRNIGQAKTRRSELLKQEVELADRLDCLSPVDEIESRLTQLENDYSQISDEIISIDNFRQEITRLELASKVFFKWFDFKLATGELQSPPQLEPTEDLLNRILSIQNTNTQIAIETNRVTNLNALTSIPHLTDTTPLEHFIEALNTLQNQIARNTLLETTLKPLHSPPQLEDTSQLQSLVQQIQEVERSFTHTSNYVNSLSALSTPPQIDDISPLRLLIENLETTSKQVQAENAIGKVLLQCKEPPTQLNLTELERLILEVESVLSQTKVLRSRDTYLSNLVPLPEWIDETELKILVGSIETAKDDHGRKQRDFNTIEQNLAVAEQELKDFIKQVGVCPTCGKELDPEEFIAAVSTLT